MPALCKHDEATVIATSSNLAFVPLANMPTYCASKAFLHSWLQSLRHQLREANVEVLELAPPYVWTELIGPAQLDDLYAMPLSDFVQQVVELLASKSPPCGEIMLKKGQELRKAERGAPLTSSLPF